MTLLGNLEQCFKHLWASFRPCVACCLLFAYRRSKYKLQTVVRTTLSGEDASYNVVMEMEDAQGHRGVKLSKELMNIAGQGFGVSAGSCSH